jgi:hypothetical protein
MNVHPVKIIAEPTLVVQITKVLSFAPVSEDFPEMASSATTSTNVPLKMPVLKVKSVKILLVIFHVDVHLDFLDLLETARILTNVLMDQIIAQSTLHAQMLLEVLNALVTLDFLEMDKLV